MGKLIVFALFAVGVVFCIDTTPVNVCPNSDAQFLNVQVLTYAGLCPELPCDFYRSDNVTALITFVNQVDQVDQITKKVNVTFGSTSLQFPLPNANKGCDDIQEGLTCPLYRDDQVVFKLQMPVSEVYPKISLTLDFYLQDQYGVVLTCFEVTANVVDKPKKPLIGKKNSVPLIRKLMKST